jgi:thiol-disulfide isomerase/thioredoxin
MIRNSLVVIVLSFIFYRCVAPNKTFEKIPPGIWKGMLLLDRKPVQKYGDDRDIEKNFDKDAELAFNFEVVYDDSSTFHIVLHNADERIKVTDISFGRDKATAKDTVIIRFPVYDTYIKAIYEDGVLEGEWIVNYRENYKIPFKAIHGISDRYDFVSKNPVQLAGTWNSTFELGTPDQYPAIALLKQNGQKVTGTFLTETGDYRYMEGIATENKLYLSAFDGAHAFLINAKVMTDKTMGGTFRSGTHYTTNWEGKLDSSAKLKDAYQLTKAVDDRPLIFKFLDTELKSISINDPRYANKVKIVQIMGTWCPNCMDETVFLKEYMTKPSSKDVAWISLGFERYKDTARSIKALQQFKKELKLNHDVLYAGYYDKKVASLSMPQLDKIMAYPTLLILDQSNKIVKIHTGFSGPATSEYKNFLTDFDETIKRLLDKTPK